MRVKNFFHASHRRIAPNTPLRCTAFGSARATTKLLPTSLHTITTPPSTFLDQPLEKDWNLPLSRAYSSNTISFPSMGDEGVALQGTYFVLYYIYHCSQNSSRCFLNPSSLEDINTMSSAYFSRSMDLFHNVPILFFASSGSNPLMNRLKRRRLRLQPRLMHSNFTTELVCDFTI